MREKAFQRANDLTEDGRNEEARAELIKLIQMGDDYGRSPKLCDIYAQLGVTEQLLGEAEKAIDAFKIAVSINPDLHACQGNLALLYHHMGYPGAKQFVEKALELCPKNEDYHNLKATLEKEEQHQFFQNTKPVPETQAEGDSMALRWPLEDIEEDEVLGESF